MSVPGRTCVPSGAALIPVLYMECQAQSRWYRHQSLQEHDTASEEPTTATCPLYPS